MTEERILDFLDGNLGASEEEELLHRLAVSPERRNLLKQHLQVRELTASLARRQFVTVPKMVTASLFTTLAANGYAGPRVPSELNQKDALQASLEKNLNKSPEKILTIKNAPLFRRSSLAITSIVSFLMGAAVLYFLMPDARQQKFTASLSNMLNGTTAPVVASQPIHSSIVSIPKRLSFVNSQTNDNLNIGKNYSFRNIENSVSTNQFKNNGILLDPTIGANSISEYLFNNTQKLPNISTVNSRITSDFASSDDVHGTSMSAKSPFDPVDFHKNEERTFWDKFTVSFRSGEGKAPGSTQALTGSLLELKASYDITDLFVAKVSVGQFMPYETQAIAAQPGFNNDGIPLLQLSPVLQYRFIVGAEMGLKFGMFNAPFEATAGFISDLQGNIIPRGGFFTSLALQDNLSMNIGLEGMIYSHDISSSIRNAQNSFAGSHPLLIGTLQQKESTGFIGPAIEMVWRF